jgi:hypothetical protein
MGAETTETDDREDDRDNKDPWLCARRGHATRGWGDATQSGFISTVAPGAGNGKGGTSAVGRGTPRNHGVTLPVDVARNG